MYSLNFKLPFHLVPTYAKILLSHLLDLRLTILFLFWGSHPFSSLPTLPHNL
jgi:hypothetical protein